MCSRVSTSALDIQFWDKNIVFSFLLCTLYSTAMADTEARKNWNYIWNLGTLPILI